MRLVEDEHGAGAHVRVVGAQGAQGVVGRDEEARILGAGAILLVVHAGGLAREALDLVGPVVEHVRGAHHEGALAREHHGRDRHDGLAEAHVVGEDGVHAAAQEETDTVLLVVAQVPLEAGDVVGDLHLAHRARLGLVAVRGLLEGLDGGVGSPHVLGRDPLDGLAHLARLGGLLELALALALLAPLLQGRVDGLHVGLPLGAERGVLLHPGGEAHARRAQGLGARMGVPLGLLQELRHVERARLLVSGPHLRGRAERCLAVLGDEGGLHHLRRAGELGVGVLRDVALPGEGAGVLVHLEGGPHELEHVPDARLVLHAVLDADEEAVALEAVAQAHGAP